MLQEGSFDNRAVESTIARMAAEAPANLEFSGTAKRPEPTLDQAREEFASSISAIAHTLFSKKYGPLVGTVTKTTVETVLKNGEENLYRAKGDATLVIQELFDRAFKPIKKKP
jgi:hypothetical protein